MKYKNSMLELIGHTPLLKLNRLSQKANLFVKCEFVNPYSIKDRVVLNIINEAERKKLLKKGDTLIEATSGNTGMAIASVAAMKGYKAILVMSEIQSLERRMVMKAFGAELVLSPASEGTKGARRIMFEILKEHPEYFYVGQHINMDNPGAHYKTTGPEIWEDMDGEIDAFVAGLGTGGTISGVGKYLKEKKQDIQLIGVEPEEAPFVARGIFHPHHIMGIAPGFVPDTLSRDIIDEFTTIREEDAFRMCRQLAQQEGLLVGISSGAIVHIMKELGEREAYADKNIVGVLYDTGERYLSVQGLFHA